MVDPFDGPEIAQVVGQIATALGVIVVAWLANRTRRDAKIVREQVENDHADTATPNIRADMDAKAEAARQRDIARKKQLDRLENKMDKVGTDVSLLKHGYQANRDDINDLMDTAAQKRREKEEWGPPPQTRRDRRHAQ